MRSPLLCLTFFHRRVLPPSCHAIATGWRLVQQRIKDTTLTVICVPFQVSVFLFDDAYNSHWRLQQGTLLALFNAMVTSSSSTTSACRYQRPV